MEKKEPRCSLHQVFESFLQIRIIVAQVLRVSAVALGITYGATKYSYLKVSASRLIDQKFAGLPCDSSSGQSEMRTQ
jgi:hypothetical protein